MKARDVVVLLAVIVLGNTVTSVISTWKSRCDVQREAIEHGAAYYHPETGAFTWKAEVPPTSEGKVVP